MLSVFMRGEIISNRVAADLCDVKALWESDPGGLVRRHGDRVPSNLVFYTRFPE